MQASAIDFAVAQEGNYSTKGEAGTGKSGGPTAGCVARHPAATRVDARTATVRNRYILEHSEKVQQEEALAVQPGVVENVAFFPGQSGYP